MTDDDRESEGSIHKVDTVPPPAEGDAYSAATVVREAPPHILEAIRKRKETARGQQGSAGTSPSPKAAGVPAIVPRAPASPAAEPPRARASAPARAAPASDRVRGASAVARLDPSSDEHALPDSGLQACMPSSGEGVRSSATGETIESKESTSVPGLPLLYGNAEGNAEEATRQRHSPKAPIVAAANLPTLPPPATPAGSPIAASSTLAKDKADADANEDLLWDAEPPADEPSEDSMGRALVTKSIAPPPAVVEPSRVDQSFLASNGGDATGDGTAEDGDAEVMAPLGRSDRPSADKTPPWLALVGPPDARMTRRGRKLFVVMAAVTAAAVGLVILWSVLTSSN